MQRKEYDLQLKELHEQMIEMGNLCQQVIALATKTLSVQEDGLYEQVFGLDAKIDRAQTDVETFCLRLLLLQQPIASDLRRVSAALKMVSDMERIGDQAADIADLSPYLVNAGLEGKVHIREMAEKAVEMVEDSVAAFVSDDQRLVQKVIQADDCVDALFEKVRDELIVLIREGSIDPKAALDLLIAAKYYERIGDHAVNIAEWVDYSITGKLQNNEHGNQ